MDRRYKHLYRICISIVIALAGTLAYKTMIHTISKFDMMTVVRMVAIVVILFVAWELLNAFVNRAWRELGEDTASLGKIIYSHRENLTAIIVMAAAAFVFLSRSPLHPWVCGTTGTDSSGFKTVALMIEHGYMPYKDSFDHKGPMIYLLNVFGDLISVYQGIWVIEYVFMLITFFALYKICRMSCKVGTALISTFVAISLLFGYFEEGNLTEEYAMMFIAVALFIYVDYFKNSTISNWRLFLCGLCFGAVLMLRVNMVTVWVVFTLSIFIRLLMQKDWKNMGYFLLWFIFGALVVIIPILIWLGCNHALGWCWKDYVLINMEYISEESGRALFSAKWNSFLAFFNTTVYIMSTAIMACMLRKHMNWFHITYFIYLLLSPMLICLSGMTYGHYGMVLIPAAAYPWSLLFGELEKNEVKQLSNLVEGIVCVYILAMIIVPDWCTTIATIPKAFETKSDDKKSDTIKTIMDIVDSRTGEYDAISVYGNWGYVYVATGRSHATQYSYQFPIGQVNPEIMEDYMAQLADELPPIIVVQEKKYDDNIESFLDDNRYQLLWNEKTTEDGNIDKTGALVYGK